MAPCSLLLFLVLCYFPLLLLAHPPIQYYGKCPLQYNCTKLGHIHFPFTNTTSIYFPFTNTTSTGCGLQIRGCNYTNGTTQVHLGNKWYDIINPNMLNEPYSIIVKEEALQDPSTICKASDFDYKIPLLPPSNISFLIPRIILYKCSSTLGKVPDNFFSHECSHSDYVIYYSIHPEEENSYDSFNSCSNIMLPIDPEFFDDPKQDPFKFLGSIHIKVSLSEKCMHCIETTNFCHDNNAPTCGEVKEKRRFWKVIVGSVFAGAAGIILLALIIYIRRRNSWAFKYQSRNISGHSNSYGDLESSGIFFGIPVFSYKELEEATNNFDHTRELGDGGFGIVYYGKLRDGRDVAVKRLYEHNYKRVQQFMTEIEILTRLRHRNLVTLYGCTSRHSRELLLVYEYIPNGTVACHLHGDVAKPGSLPWPVRMRIAVETASALVYLHAHDTIHRDVKTNNILLDEHFSVKVADFGLSRLFPEDVTHISTAPQGTPGYLDPEYHIYYQLTTKSDVYSFGVVLIELISSMLAVDITRIRDEINLANLALKKIQNCALSELVDPSLGFESDNEVRRMIASVAELAFQCLQMDKELRPSMDQVLSELERIENGTDKLEHLEEEDLHEIQISNSKVHPPPSLSPENDEVGYLKNHSK